MFLEGGWGTWIRTRTKRVRAAGNHAVKLLITKACCPSRPVIGAGIGARMKAGQDGRRVYLKEMSKSGEVVEWLKGKGLLERAETNEPYWRSIYEHHGRDHPWLCANQVIERVPEN